MNHLLRNKYILILTLGILHLGIVSCTEDGGGSATTQSEQSAPVAPSNLYTAFSSNTQIDVSWDAVNRVTYYEVFRNVDTNVESSQKVSPANLKTTLFRDTTNISQPVYYWTKACNSFDCSDYSKIRTAIRPPSNVIAAFHLTNQIDITWDAINGISRYEIFRNTSNNPSGSTKIIPKDATARTYSDTSGIEAGIYYYWLKACNKIGCSDYSNVAKAAIAPAPPTNLQTTFSAINTVEISWNATSGASYYQVFRDTKLSPSLDKKINTANITAITYQDSEMTALTPVYYWVKACNEVGCSAFSTIQPVVRAPTNLQATFASATEVNLSWSAVKGVSRYEIYRNTDTNLTGSIRVSPTNLAGTTYKDITAADAAKDVYYYWLKACNAIGCSGYSEMLTAIRAPANVQVAFRTSTTVDISWDAVTGGSHYEIYRDSEGKVANSKKISPEGLTTTNSTIAADAAKDVYYYWLKACNANGCSGFSEATTIVRAPKNLQALFSSMTQVDISWDTVNGINRYEMYRDTDTHFDGSTKVNLTNQTATAYKDTSGFTADRYYYWVKACNAVGCSDVSKVRVLKPLCSMGKICLNDTGITWAGDYPSVNKAACSSNIADTSQDCDYGRDAQTFSKKGGGVAGFDFTKLGSDGEALAMQNIAWSDSGTEAAGSQWSCVQDNHTGLIWEVKTNKTGIHNKDNTYRWGGKTAQGIQHASTNKGSYYSDWDTLVDGTNTEKLCGFSDWVVPTLEELTSIANKDNKNPAIDTTYFPHIPSEYFWSSSAYADRSSFAWQIGFENGQGDGSYQRSDSARVMLVRRLVPAVEVYTDAVSSTNKQAYIPNAKQDARYTVSTQAGGQIVVDNSTDLMWKVCSEGLSGIGCNTGSATTYTWKTALEHAQGHTFAGHSDWRLPNINELRSLVAHDRTNPAINSSVFPKTSSDRYWSSSPYAADNNKVWILNFYFGTDVGENRNQNKRLRLVRNK